MTPLSKTTADDSAKLGKHFSLAELTRTSVPVDNTPPCAATDCLRDLVEFVLDPLREIVVRPIAITSGFRSKAVNAAVGGAATSQHTLGQAVDFTIEGLATSDIVRLIIDRGLPFDQVIDEFGRWVHVSYGPRHRRQALHAKKVAGRTVYVPFDATPGGGGS